MGLKILGVGWHTTHQYSLAQLPFVERYSLIVEPWRRGFSTTQRPFPQNMDYVNTFEKGEYDFALLHIDQQSIYDPSERLRISKGRLFKELIDVIREKDPNLPVIVINHMVPFHDDLESAEVVRRIKRMTAGCIMICNSYQARNQWGWGEVITHGLQPDEWGFDVPHFKLTGEIRIPPKEPRCVVVLSPKGMEKAYRRTFLHETMRLLEEYGVFVEWIGVTKKFDTFDGYRDFMARSLIHFFPAWQSPRPRSRTEGMLSRQCILSTPYQDANTFIKSGTFKQETKNGIKTERVEYGDEDNGFLTNLEVGFDPRVMDNPQYSADLIRYLLQERPDIAIEFGNRARKYAEEHLDNVQYENQWREFLKKHNLYKVEE
jgi:hypothetical protein